MKQKISTFVSAHGGHGGGGGGIGGGQGGGYGHGGFGLGYKHMAYDAHADASHGLEYSQGDAQYGGKYGSAVQLESHPDSAYGNGGGAVGGGEMASASRIVPGSIAELGGYSHYSHKRNYHRSGIRSRSMY